MLHVSSMFRVRIGFSKCLALFCALWVLNAVNSGSTNVGHDDCESSGDSVTCCCDCHGVVVPHPDPYVLPDAELAQITSREPHAFIYMIESDIFRPPIA